MLFVHTQENLRAERPKKCPLSHRIFAEAFVAPVVKVDAGGGGGWPVTPLLPHVQLLKRGERSSSNLTRGHR